MKTEKKNLNMVLGAKIISTNPTKCETCKNDAAGTHCAKLYLYGGEVCVAKKQFI